MSRFVFDDSKIEMPDDEFYMREAIREAEFAFQEDEVPVGAIIVCQNRIIARAHNLVEKLNDVTAHAEMQAYTIASNYLGGKYLTDCTLYVTLEPCIMCAGASYWTQIPRIVFGAADKDRGFIRMGKNILHPKTELRSGVLELECSTLIKDFFKEKRDRI